MTVTETPFYCILGNNAFVGSAAAGKEFCGQ